MRFKHIAIVIALAILPSTSVEAKNYYRFKDDNGRLVVKDYLPNSALKSGYEIINENGRLIETVPPVMTKEQKEAERIRQIQLKEQQEKARAARNHDRMLLRQYRTIDDIKRTQKNQTASLQINISIIQGRNNTLKDKLSELQTSAANAERKGNRVPQALVKQIKATEEQIAENEESVEGYKEQIVSIEEQFQNDLVRFKELQAQQFIDGYNTDQNQLALSTSVLCEDANSCDRSWKLAQVFAHENASNKLEIVTDSLIISSKPKSAQQIGLSITRIPTGEEAMQIVLEVQCHDSKEGQSFCKGSDIVTLKDNFVNYISENER